MVSWYSFCKNTRFLVLEDGPSPRRHGDPKWRGRVMGDPEHRNLSAEEAIKVRFEKTLTRHVGIKDAYDDLPLDLESLSIGILLVEQENEVKNGLCKPSERYSRDTLTTALAEIGVQSNGAGNRVTADMAKNGYVEIDTEGRLFAQARLTDFIQKLNASFPRMQGLNLVAYLIQTMDEVLSGRKNIEFALEQLDQTLHHQRQNGPPPETGRPSLSQSKPDPAPQQDKPSTDSLKSALSKRLRKRQTQGGTPAKQESNECVVVSAGGKAQPLNVQSLFSPKPEIAGADEPASGFETPALGFETEDQQDEEPDYVTDAVRDLHIEEEDRASAPKPDDGQETAAEPEAVSSDHDPSDNLTAQTEADATLSPDVCEEPDGQVDEASPKDEPSIAEASSESTPPSIPAVSEITPTDGAEEADGVSDQTVQERIESFYQSLALTCPVCHSGRILEQNTEKGKVFFTCSNSECVFVSWGKPHILVCPWCKNPFLIEGTGKDGNAVLKCPRATCHYQQPVSDDGRSDPADAMSPGGPGGGAAGSSALRAKKPIRKPKRRVRRRVVRKKR